MMAYPHIAYNAILLVQLARIGLIVLPVWEIEQDLIVYASKVIMMMDYQDFV